MDIPVEPSVQFRPISSLINAFLSSARIEHGLGWELRLPGSGGGVSSTLVVFHSRGLESKFLLRSMVLADAS